MFYTIKEGRLAQLEAGSVGVEEESGHIGVVGYSDIFSTADSLGIAGSENAFKSHTPRFESHDSFDFLCAHILKGNVVEECDNVYIYLRANLLLFICDDVTAVEKIIDNIVGESLAELNFGRLICAFFDRLTERDAHILDEIENEISDLEDELITKGKRNPVKEIIGIRKRLLALKRYYEQLLGGLEAVQENENQLLDKRTLRAFKILSGRVDRLFHSVLNLRDYITQVREAYQAEVDIQLNLTMKLFTVLTAIFLPLTLIVGWYGMNFQMPEYTLRYGYIIPIVASIIVVAICIWLFKKHKWF